VSTPAPSSIASCDRVAPCSVEVSALGREIRGTDDGAAAAGMALVRSVLEEDDGLLAV
jgi:hypothetical protein